MAASARTRVCGQAVDQDLALLDQPDGIVEAGEAALEQGE
jgi:hypothetical protein